MGETQKHSEIETDSVKYVSPLSKSTEDGKQYISDLITLDDVDKWTSSTLILINSSTGSGKSYFVINKLGSRAKERNEKILFLTNRSILKNQIKNSIPYELKHTIHVATYQGMTESLLKRNMDLSGYTYIVSDECHYFFADSGFNHETDTALETILRLRDCFKIFLSATSCTFERFIITKSAELDYDKPIIYKLKDKLNYDKLYHYKNNNTILAYLRTIPKNEKAIMFCSSIEIAYHNYKLFADEASFICSSHTQSYLKKYSDLETKKEIEEHQKFSSRFLFTTKVLDNGVNIVDRDLKHIITDINDFDTVEQCIGRKRFIDDKDKVNVYIQRLHKQGLNGFIYQLHNALKELQDFRQMSLSDYTEKYGHINKNGLIYVVYDNTANSGIRYKINEAKEYKIKADRDDYIEMKLMDSPIPNIDMIARRYKISPFAFKNLEKEIDLLNFDKGLSQFLSVKLFNDDKKKFINFIQSTAVAMINKERKVGLNTINGYFKDIKYPYYIESKKERQRTSDKYNKNYWILNKIPSDQLTEY